MFNFPKVLGCEVVWLMYISHLEGRHMIPVVCIVPLQLNNSSNGFITKYKDKHQSVFNCVQLLPLPII